MQATSRYSPRRARAAPMSSRGRVVVEDRCRRARRAAVDPELERQVTETLRRHDVLASAWALAPPGDPRTPTRSQRSGALPRSAVWGTRSQRSGTGVCPDAGGVIDRFIAPN